MTELKITHQRFKPQTHRTYTLYKQTQTRHRHTKRNRKNAEKHPHTTLQNLTAITKHREGSSNNIQTRHQHWTATDNKDNWAHHQPTSCNPNTHSISIITNRNHILSSQKSLIQNHKHNMHTSRQHHNHGWLQLQTWILWTRHSWQTRKTTNTIHWRQ